MRSESLMIVHLLEVSNNSPLRSAEMRFAYQSRLPAYPSHEASYMIRFLCNECRKTLCLVGAKRKSASCTKMLRNTLLDFRQMLSRTLSSSNNLPIQISQGVRVSDEIQIPMDD